MTSHQNRHHDRSHKGNRVSARHHHGGRTAHRSITATNITTDTATAT